MKKGGGSQSTIIIGPSKSVLVYALHSLEYVLGLARFRVFVPKLFIYYNLFYFLIILIFLLQKNKKFGEIKKFNVTAVSDCPLLTI